MAIELITGYAGSGHISSSDAGGFNAGVCGTGQYVLPTLDRFACTIESSNQLRIGSGDAVNQGRHIRIPYGSSEAVTIENGSQGKSRNDLIVIAYTKDQTTGVEAAEIVVHKGAEVATGATVPSVQPQRGDILEEAAGDEMPLYEVKLVGTNIESVDQLFTELVPLSDIRRVILDAAYPVGAIYTSTAPTNPKNFFGGTWERIRGKFLFAENSNYEAGTTGGASKHTLTASEMPAHTHNGPSHTHSGPEHQHTGPSHTHDGPSHTHSGPSHTHSGPSHTHPVPAHTHTASIAESGAHTHKEPRLLGAGAGTDRWAAQGTAKDPTRDITGGAHTHAVTINNCAAFNTNAAGTGQTGASGTGQTGASGTGKTSASGTGLTGKSGTGQTGASGTGATSSTGGGAAHNNMPPYLVVYMWKRTA